MPKITSFRDLIAWQKAMDLADKIYSPRIRFRRESASDWRFKCENRRFQFRRTSLRATDFERPGM